MNMEVNSFESLCNDIKFVFNEKNSKTVIVVSSKGFCVYDLDGNPINAENLEITIEIVTARLISCALYIGRLNSQQSRNSLCL